jgi:hypothetical protein
MTRSDPSGDAEAREVLEVVIRRLDEDGLIARIDAPVDQAVARHEAPVNAVTVAEPIHRRLAPFVMHLYAHASPWPRHLSPQQAADEAVVLLETGDERPNGYDTAVLDARFTEPDGLSVVRSRLAETVKRRWRYQYTQWVLAVHLPPMEWALRSRVAGLLLDRLDPWLPAEMDDRRPDRFVDALDHLIQIHLDLKRRFESVGPTGPAPAN